MLTGSNVDDGSAGRFSEEAGSKDKTWWTSWSSHCPVRSSSGLSAGLDPRQVPTRRSRHRRFSVCRRRLHNQTTVGQSTLVNENVIFNWVSVSQTVWFFCTLVFYYSDYSVLFTSIILSFVLQNGRSFWYFFSKIHRLLLTQFVVFSASQMSSNSIHAVSQLNWRQNLTQFQYNLTIAYSISFQRH